MLPPVQTNRYGDMLKEFYEGLRNNNLSQVRMDEIQRAFNELWLDFQKRNLGPDIKNPLISNPIWITSPLHTFHAYLTTDTEIANDTHTKITFETQGGDATVFEFLGGDKSKISISKNPVNVHFAGMVAWEANGTGYRNTQLRIFEQDGTQIGSLDLHNLPAATGVTTVLPISYNEDPVTIFPDAEYFEFWVRQNSGSPIDVTNFVLSVSLA